MSNAMNLAIQITLIDMLSGIASRVKNSILSLGDAGKKVKNDFEQMQSSITKGLKAIAVSSYAMHKALPGVKAAGDLQESMIDVKMNLMEAGKSARDLDAELSQVKGTAIEVSKVAPFSAQDVVDIQNTFLKAGLNMKDVIGKSGAAFTATALATITKEAPNTIAESLVSIASPFNIKGEGYGELADFLQKVDTASVTTVPELMEGMKYVAGNAANMKVSWKDTLVAMGAMSQQGLRGSIAGTSLNDFLLRLNAITPMSRKVMQHLGLSFHDAKGQLKPLHDIVEQLRTKFGKLQDRQKIVGLEKIFGIEGARAALALMHEGEGSWEAVAENIQKAVSLQDKMDERLKGFNANLKALAGTAKTTLATLFDPVLQPLTKILSLLNEATGKLGEFAEKNKAFATAVSGGVGAVAVGAGAYGLFNILKGGAAGARVLKGLGGVKGLLKGFGGTAAGIAQGKAVEAVTGVTPVFVTNWPANFGGSAAETAAGIAGKAGMLKKIAPFAGKAGLVGAVAGGGYAIGTGINWLLNKGVSGLTGGKNDSLGGWLYDLLHKKENPEVKNNITMNVSIDDKGRVIAETSDMNTKANINTMKRGQF